MGQNQTLVQECHAHTTVQVFKEYVGPWNKVRKVYATTDGKVTGVLLSNNKKYKFDDPPTYIRGKKWKIFAEIHVKDHKFYFFDGDLFYFEDFVSNETLSSDIAVWLFDDRMPKEHYCTIS
jgi:hypothetical protein